MVRPLASIPAAALLLALVVGTVWADAASTQESIRALAAPGEATRRRAVEALVDALPASRAPVVEALPGARPEVQIHLIEVLGRDGSSPAIRALLDALRRAEPLQASRIRSALARHAEAAKGVLEAWAGDPTLRAAEGKAVAPSIQALEALLRRGEAERIFLSRKSRTGGTGSYHGQYEALRPYRKEALDLCIGILLDRAMEEPGVFTTGRFELLRTPDRRVDMDELTGMASHAFGELGQETDHAQIEALAAELPWLHRLADERVYEDRVEFLEAVGRYTDIVVALYRVSPDVYEKRVDSLLRKISFGAWNNWMTRSYKAAILLRVGRYEPAIREYEYLMDKPDPLGLRSRALTYYNLACALAQWGEGLEGAEQEQKRRKAIEYLERTVREGWSDTGWLDEDKDLDPIRDTDRFRALREAIVRANTPPDDE